jgi:hypothetical protein
VARLQPSEAGSGVIKYEEVGGVMVITWDNVESYPTTAVNPSTIQFQFDETSGVVTIVWQAIEAIGGTGFLQGSDHIIGYSPGGPSPDTGPIDITTLTSQVLQFPEKFPLALGTSAKPLIGTTINLNTSANTPNSLGINFVSLVQIPAPGFDLGVIGAPGCAALLDINQGVGKRDHGPAAAGPEHVGRVRAAEQPGVRGHLDLQPVDLARSDRQRLRRARVERPVAQARELLG